MSIAHTFDLEACPGLNVEKGLINFKIRYFLVYLLKNLEKITFSEKSLKLF